MLRKQSSETDPADWFYTAQERLRSVDVLWSNEGLTFSGIELLQEAVERFLKGYLVAKGWRLEKTHDLNRLLNEAISFDSSFGQFRSLATDLTKDFFAQHYPGGDWTDIGQDHETLRHDTESLVRLIRQILPQHFPAPDPK